jgi:hypothetical protein
VTIPSAWTAVEDAIHAWVVAGSGLPAASVLWENQGAPRPAGAFVSMRLSSIEARGHDWLQVENNPLVIPNTRVVIDPDDDTMTAVAHGLLTGDGPIQLSSTSTPGGTAIATDYWLVRVDADTLKLAASFLDAMAASPVTIDITSAGSNVDIIDTDATARAGAEIVHRVRGPRTAILNLQAFGGLDGTGHGAASPLAMLTGVQSAYMLPAVRAGLIAAGIGVGSREPARSVDGILAATTSEARATSMIRLHLASELNEVGTFIERVVDAELVATDNETETGFTVTIDPAS